ncbi:MAG: GH1 family beta-glucosidase [Granulosicoccus sp.]
MSINLIDKPSSRPEFPSDFLFGVATAAYQIEGAVNEGGRGRSIWDTFSHEANNVRNADTGDIACDHYHRWQSDLDIIASLGVDAYRFSIAWSRLYPNGDGELNTAGVDFYNKLIDGCVERGIKVYVTLYHWDLPQHLYDLGGWTHRPTAELFARYASTVTRLFGDRIDSICTFNEPWCSSILSYLYGIHAPGLKDLDTTLAVIHGQHRAHGLAVQAIRAERPELHAGIVLNPLAIKPATNTPSDVAAATRHHQFHNGLFLDPLFKGEYPAEILNTLGDRLPKHWQADMQTIQQPLDYWGLNYYTPEYITTMAGDDMPFPATKRTERENVSRTDIGWEIDANAMSHLLSTLYRQYSLPPCYITENGAAFNHEVKDGAVDDQPRIDYIDAHLTSACQSIEQGIPLRGYFAWSLMDNFEWAEGYAMRFGLVHVNYQTQQRTLKNSAHWYQNLVRQHKKRA